MSIPDKAVEAAANAVKDAQNVPFSGTKQRTIARAALEAAAPLIAAQALRDAAEEVIIPGTSSVVAAWLNTRADRLTMLDQEREQQ
jgi:hypothetical protein